MTGGVVDTNCSGIFHLPHLHTHAHTVTGSDFPGISLPLPGWASRDLFVPHLTPHPPLSLCFGTPPPPPTSCRVPSMFRADRPLKLPRSSGGVPSPGPRQDPAPVPRSRGRGGRARGAGRHGLHRGGNRRLVPSGQDDVRRRGRQRGWSRRGQPGGDASVGGGSWTLHIIQHPPGLHWVSFWSLAWRLKKGTFFLFPRRTRV